MSARFEIVQTDAEQPWHAKFVGGNGETVWTTENYEHRAGAMNAITVIASVFGGFTYEPQSGPSVASPISKVGDVEIRDVDEREK